MELFVSWGLLLAEFFHLKFAALKKQSLPMPNRRREKYKKHLHLQTFIFGEPYLEFLRVYSPFSDSSLFAHVSQGPKGFQEQTHPSHSLSRGGFDSIK